MSIETHMPPSGFVQRTKVYKKWCSVVQCPDCGMVAKYEDRHPVNPCTECGNKNLKEKVGRWIAQSKWYEFKIKGYWELMPQVDNK